MILVVDTNIVFSALLRDSTIRGLLIDCAFTLYAPENIIKELKKYRDEICSRAGYSHEEFDILLSLVTESIVIIEKERYAEQLTEADKLLGHVDKGDVPFLALAMSIPCGIWTENVKHFRVQNKVKVLTTKEIMELIR